MFCGTEMIDGCMACGAAVIHPLEHEDTPADD
jgi:hypothetical protein